MNAQTESLRFDDLFQNNKTNKITQKIMAPAASFVLVKKHRPTQVHAAGNQGAYLPK